MEQASFLDRAALCQGRKGQRSGANKKLAFKLFVLPFAKSYLKLLYFCTFIVWMSLHIYISADS